MNATLASPMMPATTATSTKPLWAAVGVLSVCVMAMGATLVHVNKRPEPLAQAAIPLSSAFAMNMPAAPSASLATAAQQKTIEKPASAVIKTVQSAPKVVAKPSSTPAVVVAQAPVPEVGSGVPPMVSSAPTPVVVAQAPAKPVCISCGTVEAVTPITREGQGSGVGVIAGGVLGGVVGNQVGKGTGRAVATVLGAVGGGLAGNTIEKKMKKETAYSVRIRMEDGSSRTIEQTSAPMVGSKVTLEGNTMRPA